MTYKRQTHLRGLLHNIPPWAVRVQLILAGTVEGWSIKGLDGVVVISRQHEVEPISELPCYTDLLMYSTH